jgi:hypothetical protein
MNGYNKSSNQDFYNIKSVDYTIERFQNELRIVITFPENYRTYKNLLYISLSGSLLFLIFIWPNFIIKGVIFLIILFLIMTPCISGYLYYKNQRHEWVFKQSNHIIIFSKVFKHLKQIKKFEFEKVRYLIYQGDHEYWDTNFYNLSIVLEKNKVIKIYIGDIKHCKELGSIISEFIGIPVNFKSQMKNK